jgi:hypothetical protein
VFFDDPPFSVFSATNQTRILIRRSLKRHTAPLAKVYVDVYQMAGRKGNVNSVSFYADRTCASADVTFAAFDLISRNLDDNTAQLVITEQSSTLRLDNAAQLKSYMHLITIRLCTGNPVWDTSANGCQGNHFAVLPHQYIGIYSSTCRFGFARPPLNRLHATTLVILNIVCLFSS